MILRIKMVCQGMLLLVAMIADVKVNSFTPKLRAGNFHSISTLYCTASSTNETPKLALLTFDLDDTLFPVVPVVTDANAAMIQALHDAGYTGATDSSILRHTKAIRRKSKSKISYTELRKRAIVQELELLSKAGDVVDYNMVHSAFNAWLDERHRSAERNLFEGAIEMLETIKEKYPFVCIAAITNGRGNPRAMNSTLAPYFDFCISGEDDDVFPEGKPQKGIYKASIAAYHKRYPHNLAADSHVWCHVGDCLANDVWGSTRNGAHAVWIEVEDLKESTYTSLKTGGQPSWSTAKPRDLKSRRKLGSKGMQDVSEKITRLSQLPAAIERILEKQYIKSIFMRGRGPNSIR